MRLAVEVAGGGMGTWWDRAPGQVHVTAPLRAVPTAPAGAWTPVGRISDPRLAEISGVVASRTHPGVLWVHNDRGDGPRIFALGPDGTVRGEVKVAGAKAFDWEDIAVGPGPGGPSAGPWLYVADVGDNKLRRSTVQVYRFPEPRAADGRVDAHRIDLSYADGRAHNAEAVIVDPRSGDLLVITKVDRAGAAQLFRARAAQLVTGAATLEPLGVVATGPLVTGADVAADGSKVVLRTYEGVYAWNVRGGESLTDALMRRPARFDAPDDAQTEAICFTPGDGQWVSIAEGRGQPILRAPVPEFAEPTGPDFW